MSNKKSIDNLNVVPKLSDITKDSEGRIITFETIGSIWENVIVKCLPPLCTAITDRQVNRYIQLHDILMKHIENDNIVFIIRKGGNQNRQGISRKRGNLYRIYNGSSSIMFTYADNSPACHSLKVLLDANCPPKNTGSFWPIYNNKELLNADVPMAFIYDRVEKPAAFECNLANPTGYKIAHILNVKGNYIDTEQNKNIQFYEFAKCIEESKIIDTSQAEGGYFWNTLSTKDNIDNLKKYFIACFLRQVHPFNFFLVPAPKYQETGINSTDIGEYAPLLEYMQEQFAEIFKDKYEEFLKEAMAPERDLEKLKKRAGKFGDLDIGLKIDPNR